MTQTLIEKIESLPQWSQLSDGDMYPGNPGDYVLISDLRAILEEYKATEQAPIGYYDVETDTPLSVEQWERLKAKHSENCEDYKRILGMKKLFTNPPLSDNTLLNAKRYLFLRDKADVKNNDPMVSKNTISDGIELFNGIELDHEIDEAMKADNEKG